MSAPNIYDQLDAALAERDSLLEAMQEIAAMTNEDTGTFRKRGGTYRGLISIIATAALAKVAP